MIQETSRQPRISPLAGQPAPKEMLIDGLKIATPRGWLGARHSGSREHLQAPDRANTT